VHAGIVVQENLWNWMMDKRGRDQFVIRYGDEAEVHWNDAQRAQAEEVYKRSFWTESFVQWSPHGSYLATVHRQGVAIWGGPSFSRLHRFSHPNVSAYSSHPALSDAEASHLTCLASFPTVTTSALSSNSMVDSELHVLLLAQ